MEVPHIYWVWMFSNGLHYNVAYICETLRSQNMEGMRVFADIEGVKVNGGIIPAEIMITMQRPDIVIINTNTTPHLSCWWSRLSPLPGT